VTPTTPPRSQAAQAHEDHTAAVDQPVFRREGEYWTIAFAGDVCRLHDSAGLRQVAHLIGKPGERVPATELGASALNGTCGPKSGPPPDLRDATEGARVRVTHTIRRALARIAKHHAALNEHLRATIKTGSHCAYLPDPRLSLRWDLRSGRQ
jgi:hypothetical protein